MCRPPCTTACARHHTGIDTTSNAYIAVQGDFTQPTRGSSTDFIDERLSVGRTIQTLYHFTNVPWTNTKVQNTAGTWTTLGSHTEVAVDMVNVVDHDILAAPAAMSSTTTFLDDYKQCG